MPDTFLHGVEVVEIDSGPRPLRTVKSAVIGVVGTAPEADEAAFPINTPVLIAGRRRDLMSLGKTGTLPPALTGIFDQAGAMMVVVRVEAGDDETAALNNVIGDADNYQGLHALLGAESTIHVSPRILIAPGFTHQRPDNNPNPVVAALIPIAERLRAIIIADGPNTTDMDTITYRKDWDSGRLYIVDPFVKVWNQVEPVSARVAGLIAKTDHELGFWWSPSNQVINGILGTARPVDFVLGDQNCRANILNSQDVATIIHQNGYRLWGNRTCSTDAKWAFLSVRRTADIINDSLLRAHLWAVDRNISHTYLEHVTEGVNAYLASLVSLGAILKGRCYADPELNTPANWAQGKVYFNFDFTPPYPAEHVTFRSHLVHDTLEESIL